MPGRSPGTGSSRENWSGPQQSFLTKTSELSEQNKEPEDLTLPFVVLVVIDTVDGEDNLEEKTREVADMFDRMCHFG